MYVYICMYIYAIIQYAWSFENLEKLKNIKRIL